MQTDTDLFLKVNTKYTWPYKLKFPIRDTDVPDIGVALKDLKWSNVKKESEILRFDYTPYGNKWRQSSKNPLQYKSHEITEDRTYVFFSSAKGDHQFDIHHNLRPRIGIAGFFGLEGLFISQLEKGRKKGDRKRDMTLLVTETLPHHEGKVIAPYMIGQDMTERDLALLTPYFEDAGLKIVGKQIDKGYYLLPQGFSKIQKNTSKAAMFYILEKDLGESWDNLSIQKALANVNEDIKKGKLPGELEKKLVYREGEKTAGLLGFPPFGRYSNTLIKVIS